jgi:DNA-binding cell septation regulator SpoVG
MSSFVIRNVKLVNETRTGPKGQVAVLAEATLCVHKSMLGRHFRINRVLANCVPEYGDWVLVKVIAKRAISADGNVRCFVDFPEVKLNGAQEWVSIAHTATAEAREHVTKLVFAALNEEVKKLVAA